MDKKIGNTYASGQVKARQKWARKPADFYPTPSDVTESLMRFLELSRESVVWEPAAGDGDMSKVINRHVDKVLVSDIRDDTKICGPVGLDFLKPIPVHAEFDWIITNPPFKLAEDFIRRALSLTPNVAMLLKSQYWHAAKRQRLFHKHQPSHVLALTWRPAFLERERGSSPMMDVIWTVWTDGSKSTRYQLLPRPK